MYCSPHKKLEIVVSESGLEYFSMLASKSDRREVEMNGQMKECGSGLR